MIVRYILIGIAACLLSAAVAVLAGASLWFALELYAVVGFAVMAVFPALHLIKRHLASRRVVDGSRTSDRTAVPGAATGRADTDQRPTLRILAVDDDRFILDLIAVICAEAECFDITAVESSDEALRLLDHPDKTFDYLLFDINMPGMNGIELCRRTRQMSCYRHTPIVMLTGLRDMENMSEAFNAGATDYVTKPFDVGSLGARFQLARERMAKGDNTLSNRRRAPDADAPLNVPRNDAPRDTGPLVSHAALSNYLTQLQRKDLGNIAVFAVTIDCTETMETDMASHHLTALLGDVAKVVAACLGSDQTIMAYVSDTDILIATPSSALCTAPDLESVIEGHLRDAAPIRDLDYADGAVLSVGGSVKLESERAQRARIATNNAVALARIRAVNKHGRPITIIHKA